MAVIVVHREESAVMQFSRTNDSFQQLELMEQVIMNLLADVFGINIGKKLICKGNFGVREVFGRRRGQSVQLGISSLVSSVETLIKLLFSGF